MKRQFEFMRQLLSVLIVMAFASLVCAAPQTKQPSDPLAQLKGQVSQVQKENQTLKNQVNQLKNEVQSLKTKQTQFESRMQVLENYIRTRSRAPYIQ